LFFIWAHHWARSMQVALQQHHDSTPPVLSLTKFVMPAYSDKMWSEQKQP
jgi:hypothetical protein